MIRDDVLLTAEIKFSPRKGYKPVGSKKVDAYRADKSEIISMNITKIENKSDINITNSIQGSEQTEIVYTIKDFELLRSLGIKIPDFCGMHDPASDPKIEYWECLKKKATSSLMTISVGFVGLQNDFSFEVR